MTILIIAAGITLVALVRARPEALSPRSRDCDLVCGRFTSSQRWEAIGERFEVAVPECYQHRFSSSLSSAR
jgi:hypothetical protein